MQRVIRPWVVGLFTALTIAVLSAASQADEPVPVFIDIHDFLISDDTALGTFEASGAVDASGEESQVSLIAGLSLHCVHTLTAAEGSIVIRSQCNLVTNVGQWRIVSGTGAYAGRKGNGSLLMVFNPDDPAEAHELLDGWVY